MANRKLQSEIERTLKKVSEGLEIFHETLEKLDTVTSAAQKEKIEVELKKEIKKLQRLRDLIKGWQMLSELKDKGAINEARRLIENEMERFKVLEKEMKIKAYSREGLSQAAKLDPREQEKLNVASWINGVVDKLETQRDALEAEREALMIQTRKSSSSGSKGEHPRVHELTQMIDRHKMHVRRLEQLLRLMENDQVEPEQVGEIREDVDYYVEANQEPDFVPDESMYEQFDHHHLGEDDEDEDSHSDDSSDAETPSTTPSKSTTSSSLHGQRRKAPAAITAEEKKPIVVPSTTTILQKKVTSPPLSTTTTTATASTIPSVASTSVSSTPSTTTTTTQHRTSASLGSLPLTTSTSTSTLSASTVTSRPSSLSSTAPSSTLAKQQQSSLLTKTTTTPLTTTTTTSAPSAMAKTRTLGATATTATTTTRSTTGALAEKPPSTRPSFASAISTTSASASVVGTAGAGATSPRTIIIPKVQHNVSTTVTAAAATSKQPTASTEVAKLVKYASLPGAYADFQQFLQRRSAAQTSTSKATTAGTLEHSWQFCPDGYESERSRHFVPRQPHPTPSHYPSTVPTILQDNPVIFERFELDTLFFIFYYQQRTYAQYFAARELKRQSWRFHKKYLTWFQRHEEPKAITEEYEAGTYIYFDYEGNWCQRKKSEFTFEYRYLEDEETV